MKQKHLNRFAILTFAGLNQIAIKELNINIRNPSKINVSTLPNYDLIVFESPLSDIIKLQSLRIAEDVFFIMGNPAEIRRKEDLSKINEIIKPENIFSGINLKNKIFGGKKPKTVTYNCFIKQDKDRHVRRKEIANQVNSLIQFHFRKWRNTDPSSIELWGFYIDEVLILGFRLSDNKMRYRGKEPILREGALRPTIAAALVSQANPQSGELIVDPMCGTGTILLEGILRNNKAQYIGGDISNEAVELARSRIKNDNVRIENWDARNLPFERETIDCFICNLPFGKKYSTDKENPTLYKSLLINWIEKLKSDGRMILLTSDSYAIESTLNSLGLGWNIDFKVKVLGTWSKVYSVQKRVS